jgi:hypothetical protein
MSELTRFTNSQVASGIGVLKRKWKSIRFFFEKRAFESKIEGILRAAAGHEGNSLPAGESQYRLLGSTAESLCTEFANRWDLDVDLLRARIPGLIKLAGLSFPPPPRNYVRHVFLGIFTIPLALFLLGAMAGLVSLGFHLVGGR